MLDADCQMAAFALGVQVRRVQMRFPSRIPTAERQRGKYPLGPPHDFTILDGEHAADLAGLKGMCHSVLVHRIVSYIMNFHGMKCCMLHAAQIV